MACIHKRVSYTVETKLQAVEAAEKSSKEAAAREFKVHPKRIREWCAQKEALKEMKEQGGGSKRRRLVGTGRKVKDDDMEEMLMNWILELHGRNIRVS